MSKPEKVIPQKVIGSKAPVYRTTCTEYDALRYALGIGFSMDPTREQDLKFTNQFHPDFAVFPTMGVVLPQPDLLSPLSTNDYIPEFSPFAILYAEHKLIMVKDKIQIGAEYEHELAIVDCQDKGKNGFFLFRVNSYLVRKDGKKQLAFISQPLSFVKGLGGFKYPGNGSIKPMPQIPKRAPDYKLSGETYPNQAFVYRLCADMNPLHVVPSIAQAQGFEKPLLHGLATYGTVARVVVQQILGNDHTKLKSIHTRFVGHVYPGQSLDILVWKVNDSYLYEAVVRERKTRAVIGSIQIRPSAKL